MALSAPRLRGEAAISIMVGAKVPRECRGQGAWGSELLSSILLGAQVHVLTGPLLAPSGSGPWIPLGLHNTEPLPHGSSPSLQVEQACPSGALCPVHPA